MQSQLSGMRRASQVRLGTAVLVAAKVRDLQGTTNYSRQVGSQRHAAPQEISVTTSKVVNVQACVTWS